MSEKESIVLALADPNKIASMLLDLGFFSKVGLRVECPYWERYYINEVKCEKKAYPKNECSWSWEKIGSNSDCLLDKELRQGYDDAKNHTFKETLARHIKFTLQAIIKKEKYVVGTADLLVKIQETLKVNEYFDYVYDSPTTYLVIVDVELKSVLKAIRYIRLLLDALKNDRSLVQPILVTKKAKNEEIFKGQGIRLYVWKE